MRKPELRELQQVAGKLESKVRSSDFQPSVLGTSMAPEFYWITKKKLRTHSLWHPWFPAITPWGFVQGRSLARKPARIYCNGRSRVCSFMLQALIEVLCAVAGTVLMGLNLESKKGKSAGVVWSGMRLRVAQGGFNFSRVKRLHGVSHTWAWCLY